MGVAKIQVDSLGTTITSREVGVLEIDGEDSALNTTELYP